jgi:hypothetical protein
VKVLSHADPTADIACTLPVNEMADRLRALQTLVGDGLEDVARAGNRLRIRINRGGRADLEHDVAGWAAAEKACCAFLGFAVESNPESVTVDIVAPHGARLTLGSLEQIVRAVGRRPA